MTWLATVIVNEYRNLTKGQTKYISLEMKLAIVAQATVNIMSSQANEAKPIADFNKAHREAIIHIFPDLE